MLVLTNSVIRDLINPEIARAACADAFIAAASGAAPVFPVIAVHGSDTRTRVNIKYGVDPATDICGFKAGTYWPDNEKQGLPNHGATMVLLRDSTGEVLAVVDASLLNRFRTAGADAVATDALARRDASVLAVFGTGRQAEYEVRAIAAVRPLKRIAIVARHPDAAATLAARLADLEIDVTPHSSSSALAIADIVVTVTSSTVALFRADDVRPGTHISAMGCDARGKQELPLDIVANARCFADLPSQSEQIGEFQHGILAGLIATSDITAIGDVLTGSSPGRTDEQAITIFDSSGLAAQDLAIAKRMVDLAEQRGLGRKIEF